MGRFQRGSLCKELRATGEWWVLRFYATREADGRRVERTTPVGLVSEFRSESAAWAEVNRLDLITQINKKSNKPVKNPSVTFGSLAEEYKQRRLGQDALKPLAHSTVVTYKMYLGRFVLPRWSASIATKITHHEIQSWLEGLKRKHKLANRTIVHLKGIMQQIFKYGAWADMIPDTCNPLAKVQCSSTSNYEPLIVTPREAGLIFSRLVQPDSTLVLLLAATAMRMSEALALKWVDVDPSEGVIHVRRSWTGAHLGETKSRSSRAGVPCIPLLAEFLQDWRDQSPYSRDDDWVFPSQRNKGKTPMSGSIWVTNHLKKAAFESGVLKKGEKRQFGAHNFRHSLATHLIATGKDVKTVQGILRHANPLTTLALYAHGRNEDHLAAQGDMMAAIFKPVTDTVQ